LIITSTLSRAAETAKAIQKELLTVQDKKVPIFKSDLFKERGLGVFQNQEYNEFYQEVLKNHIQPSTTRFEKMLDSLSMVNYNQYQIEKQEEFIARAIQSFEFIKQKYREIIYKKQESHIVIVSHGYYLRAMFGLLVSDFRSFSYFPCYFLNTSVSKLEYNVIDGKFLHLSIGSLNDITHLKGLANAPIGLRSNL
jgi:broad specificity phosphatase PhoE